MIELRDVRVSYDDALPILKGVSLSIGDGEFVAFVGTNGAGKSTTMRLMNGLLLPETGAVRIDGVPTSDLRTSELARRVGFLFQNPDRQICCNTVRDELLFGFTALGQAGPEAEERVRAIAEEFGLRLDDDPFLLNRGARQLLALASVVVTAPPVVVLDEPTTGLDYRECTAVMEHIRALHARGTTVIMVCHDMEIVADYAPRTVVMSDGRVIADGPTFDVLRDRAVLERASLIPPQVVDIALGLQLMRPELANAPIAAANTVDELAAAVLAQAGVGGAAAPGQPVGSAAMAGAQAHADVQTEGR